MSVNAIGIVSPRRPLPDLVLADRAHTPGRFVRPLVASATLNGGDQQKIQKWVVPFARRTGNRSRRAKGTNTDPLSRCCPPRGMARFCTGWIPLSTGRLLYGTPDLLYRLSQRCCA